MFRRTSAAISPTALYTGTVWRRAGLSHPAFASRAGTAVWTGLLAPRRVAELLGGPRLDAMLLARHHAIDTVLERAIDAGEVDQVVELAAGLSPRGWRFMSRYGPELSYVETDLPAMARRKHEALSQAGLLVPGHRVQGLDAFAPAGLHSLEALASGLDPDRGTAIITEGLINYFPMSDVVALWASVATTLRRFVRGMYVSDLHLDQAPGIVTATAKVVMAAVVRGSVYLHFEDEQAALEALRQAGFDDAALLLPSSFAGAEVAPGVDRNHIVKAVTVRSSELKGPGAA